MYTRAILPLCAFMLTSVPMTAFAQNSKNRAPPKYEIGVGYGATDLYQPFGSPDSDSFSTKRIYTSFRLYGNRWFVFAEGNIRPRGMTDHYSGLTRFGFQIFSIKNIRVGMEGNYSLNKYSQEIYSDYDTSIGIKSDSKFPSASFTLSTGPYNNTRLTLGGGAGYFSGAYTTDIFTDNRYLGSTALSRDEIINYGGFIEFEYDPQSWLSGWVRAKYTQFPQQHSIIVPDYEFDIQGSVTVLAGIRTRLGELGFSIWGRMINQSPITDKKYGYGITFVIRK